MIFVDTRKILALVITLVLAAVTTFPAHAEATTSTERVIEPFDTIAIACNGEVVLLSGELLLIFHTTVDSRGGFHDKFTLVPRNVRGVGSETGTEYKAVGGDRSSFTADIDDGPVVFTNTDMFNLVSNGSADNLQGKFTFHITINANGEITSEVDAFSEKCVG